MNEDFASSAARVRPPICDTSRRIPSSSGVFQSTIHREMKTLPSGSALADRRAPRKCRACARVATTLRRCQLLLPTALLTFGLNACESTPGAGSDSQGANSAGSKSKKPDGTSAGKTDPKSNENGPNQSSEKDDGETPDSSQNEQGPVFDMSIPEPEKGEDIGCDIDFLFVVDNSRSMVDNQKSLANSVPDFIQTITKKIANLESYHIGVISTDESQYNKVGDVKHCSTLGGLIVRTADYTPGADLPFDRPCHPYASGKYFMTDEDNLDEKFTCAAKLGPMGSGNERPMDALQAAMSEKLTAKDACNEGFFREDAILVVVLVTDEEDDIETEDGSKNGSAGDPQGWYKRLLKFKNNRPEYLVVLSLLGTPEPNECDYTYEPGGEPKDGEGIKSAEVSERLMKFTTSFGERGVVGDVCADNYDSFFKRAVSILDLACKEIPR